MEVFNFEEEEFLHKKIDESKESNEVNISNVWHEMGHVIGNLICQKLGYKLGKITEIHLKGINGSKVKYDNLFFHVENSKMHCHKENLDFYGYPNCNYLDFSDEEEMKQKVETNSKLLLFYFIQLFSGGIFNIYYLNKNPDFECFENCFRDTDITNLESVNGRAGNDWTKCRRYLGYIKGNLGEIIYFRNELFNVFQEYKIFESFQSLIEKTAERFNEKIINKMDLEETLLEVKSILDTIENKFFEKLKEEIDLCFNKM